MFEFAVDAWAGAKARPNLAQWPAEPYTQAWREFGQHWPGTVPCELIEHCALHAYPHSVQLVAECLGAKTFYPIHPAWFDHDLDYFALIPAPVFDRGLTVLFYYHEGDNPAHIHNRLAQLCRAHARPPGSWLLVSGNTAADRLPQAVWWPDHELLYWARNRHVAPEAFYTAVRPYTFTVLNRTHKWWRATVMADLWHSGALDLSQWSYNWDLPLGDQPCDNPIQSGRLGLDPITAQFQDLGTQRCDDLSADQHNNHHGHVAAHYQLSYCNIVVETHFDADGSGGAFLTEKTFKPIRHAQPFVIVGAAGSIAALRSLGYRTFDAAVDHSYDRIADNTERWLAVRAEILRLQQVVGPEWLEQCKSDVLHNQQHFLAAAQPRLNTLYDKLLHKLAAP